MQQGKHEETGEIVSFVDFASSCGGGDVGGYGGGDGGGGGGGGSSGGDGLRR